MRRPRTWYVAALLLADLVVLDRDLLNIPPTELKDVGVLYTVTGGRVVYEKGN